jgi:hypothetical protein
MHDEGLKPCKEVIGFWTSTTFETKAVINLNNPQILRHSCLFGPAFF